jgi:hypothetical protein
MVRAKLLNIKAFFIALPNQIAIKSMAMGGVNGALLLIFRPTGQGRRRGGHALPVATVPPPL